MNDLTHLTVGGKEDINWNQRNSTGKKSKTRAIKNPFPIDERQFNLRQRILRILQWL